MTHITCDFGAKHKRAEQPPAQPNADGERKLWVAVMAQIIGDALLTLPDPKREDYGELRYEKALSISLLEKLPTHFRQICSLAGMDAEAVRERWLAGAIKDPAHISKVTRPWRMSKRQQEYEARMVEAQKLLAGGMTREQIAEQMGKSLYTICEYIAGGPKNARRRG